MQGRHAVPALQLPNAENNKMSEDLFNRKSSLPFSVRDDNQPSDTHRSRSEIMKLNYKNMFSFENLADATFMSDGENNTN